MSAAGNRQTERARTALPWEELLAFAFGILRLPPNVVWSMTLRELSYAAKALVPQTPEPLAKADIFSMMEKMGLEE